MDIFPRRSEFLALLTTTILFFAPYAVHALEGAQTISLDAPDSVNIYQTFPVQFTGPIASGDMLRFADIQGKILGGSYAYVGNAKNGTVNLTAPIDPGTYQIVYLSNKQIVASKTLTVVAVSAEVSGPVETNINEPIQVMFKGPLNNGDYLQVTDAAGKPLSGLYGYVGNAKNNALKLRVPAVAGDYRAAYFTGKREIGAYAFRVIDTSAVLNMAPKITAGAHFPVAWSGPNNPGDMLRVQSPEGKNTGSYGYTGNSPESMTLRAPETVGRYKVVYLTAQRVIGEVTFEVTDVIAELSAADEAPGNQYFAVNWKGPGNHGDLIHLVTASAAGEAGAETAPELAAYRYIDPRKGESVSVLAPKIPGDYELRYVTHGGRILAQRTIHITPAQQKPGTLFIEGPKKTGLPKNSAIEVVLDASGSMLQRQGDSRRIEIAKRTLQTLLRETIPQGTLFALRVFGHKESDSCRTDLEIPLAPLSIDKTARILDSIAAMNLAKTPIADSLAKTVQDLAAVSGERIIILLTDGEETCGGDPAAAIAALRAMDIDARVSIVGYAIDDADLQTQFAQWATLGGGEYFDVEAEAGLAKALTKAVAPRYEILDATGVVISEGLVKGGDIELAPGPYAVRILGVEHAVEIITEKRTILSIDN